MLVSQAEVFQLIGCSAQTFALTNVKDAAVNFMKLHGAFDALPEIAVFNANTLSKANPFPVVFFPNANVSADAPANVFAGRDQRNVRGLFEGFDSSHNCQ